MRFIDQKGFTLVEVIIASVILFSAIAIGSAAYRLAVNSFFRIDANVAIAEALPNVMELVRSDIMAGAENGKEKYNSHIAYEYTSRIIKTSTNIKSGYDEVTGGIEYGSYNVFLKEVDLVINLEKDGVSKSASYKYNELVWRRG